MSKCHAFCEAQNARHFAMPLMRSVRRLLDGTASMTLRIAVPNDVESIRRCIDAAFGCYTERIGRRPSSMTKDFLPLVEAGSVYVCELDGRLVGTMTVTAGPDYVELSSVAVEPMVQRQGIGKRLMAFAEEMALRRGVYSLRLYTNAALPEVVQYYEGIGYRVVERNTHDGFNRIYLEKRLPRASA
jgi:GNAT superfamily N-acetyltransferase